MIFNWFPEHEHVLVYLKKNIFLKLSNIKLFIFGWWSFLPRIRLSFYRIRPKFQFLSHTLAKSHTKERLKFNLLIFRKFLSRVIWPYKIGTVLSLYFITMLFWLPPIHALFTLDFKLHVNHKYIILHPILMNIFLS